MMVKRIIILFLLIVAAGSAYAQTGTDKSGFVLWKISGKGLYKPSYLLGTMHLKSGEYFNNIPGAKTALQSCEQVVGELSMADMIGMQIKMRQAMLMPSDTTYKMLYSDDDYRFVSSKISSFASGYGMDNLSKFKPAAIQLTLVAAAYMKYFPGVDPANTMDKYIQDEAVKEQKTVLGLETVDDQIRVLFSSGSLQTQADALLCFLKNTDQLTALIPEQIKYYNQGNLNKLYQQFKDDNICQLNPSETAAINKDRNIAWMKKLPGIMKNRSSFIAVGALHLAGEDGLLNLLEKAGYRVEPVGF